ncbi:MAG: hypothetical protein KatS3mg111_0174 [Pirellulaceae bacterium]|nr:MAG: hypothetical protein KatS3mg111_0174 [Pirellulaceae bacterium]
MTKGCLFTAALATLVMLGFLHPSSAMAQHAHHHGGSEAESAPKPKPPRVFLDKSPKVVEYQLRRLSNDQLLLIETSADDPKFDPVLMAILTREGMAKSHRQEALAALQQLRKAGPIPILQEALERIEGDDTGSQQTRRAIAHMLLAQPTAALRDAKERLLAMAASDSIDVGRTGYAGLIVSGHVEAAWNHAQENGEVDRLLDSFALIDARDSLVPLLPQVIELVGSGDATMRAAALRALQYIPGEHEQRFRIAAKAVADPQTRDAAVATLLSTPPSARDPRITRQVVDGLVRYAEETPAEQRTEEEFLDAMQLVDQLLVALPADVAKSYRERLRKTTVRVIRIRTVEEEMRYDTPYFAVEAGRPVQVVLINEDLMPHNLVITVPGALQEVAELGLAVGPDHGKDGKQYVPDSEKVLFATHMVPAHAEEKLTFVAPDKPGEYPYVCTFPRHWMRMYGVMVVVEDLDAWLRNPIPPQDPIGSNRAFVQAWTIDDFPDLKSSLRGRSMEIGERLFVEATCAQCHKLGDLGVGKVGPDLATVFAKYQNDTRTVLQEILDPSHRIDEKYAVHMILDVDGKTHTGLIVGEDDQSVHLLDNPEAATPVRILKEDIEQQVKTANSMMPKGLLDRFSRDEILEILAFIQAHQRGE